MRTFVIAAAAHLLSGCATVTTLGNTFEGGTDYTIVPLAQKTDANGLYPQATATTADRDACTDELPCIALNRTSRFQNYPSSASPEQYFTSSDKIHISLKTATIGWFSEGGEQRLLNNIFNAFSHSPLKGEIAIIANVTEDIRQPGSLDQDGNLKGRVVFYSGDVYKGQRLNEFNVPIYGPANYGGGPLTIDLWVLELDRAESQQMGSVLGTLADLAKSFPAASTGAIDFLSQIGTSFLDSNRDDQIGHFTVTLMPPSIGVKAADPILSVSDILIRRTEVRTTTMSFQNCYYQPLTGRIIGDPADCGGPLDNFLVVAVRKSSGTKDIAPTVELAEFQERILKASGQAEFAREMQEFANFTIRANSEQRAFATLARLQDASAVEAEREFDASSLIKQLQCSLLAAHDADDALFDSWCDKGGKPRQMPADSFAKVARRLVGIACVQPGELSTNGLVGNMTEAALRDAHDTLKPKILSSRSSCAT